MQQRRQLSCTQSAGDGQSERQLQLMFLEWGAVMPGRKRLSWLRAEFLALGAAVVNGMIGPLNRIAFDAGATHQQVAFLKSFGAFLVLLVICLATPRHRETLIGLRKRFWPLAWLSFTGITCVYAFETSAYLTVSIPLVSLLIYAAGGVVLPLSALVLGERLRLRSLTAFVLIFAGIAMLYTSLDMQVDSMTGVGLALLGGFAYATFIICGKAFRAGNGLPHLVWMFGLSSLFLAIPWWSDGAGIPGGAAMVAIIVQIAVPAIGGYWLTMLALHKCHSASSIQIIEMSEPLFACLYAFLLFGESLDAPGLGGALMIMGGLILSVMKSSGHQRSLQVFRAENS